MNCNATIKSGEKKGQICGRTAKSNGRCGYHFEDKSKPIKVSPAPTPAKNIPLLPEEDCVICMDELKQIDLPFNRYKEGLCVHRLHKGCILKTGKLQCPICRGDVSTAFNAAEKAECNRHHAKYVGEELREYERQLIEDEDEHMLDFIIAAMNDAMNLESTTFTARLTIRMF